MRHATLLLLSLVINLSAGAGTATAGDATVIATQRPSYPLQTCIVCQSNLADARPIEHIHEDRLVRLCCTSCRDTFSAQPSWFFRKIDEAVIDEQRDSYPLDTCPISGLTLGSKGDAHDQVYGTRLVRFCCDRCLDEFDKDPQATMATIDAALIEAQRDGYPTEICLVMDMRIDAIGEPVDLLYGTRLVRLCCEPCVKEFWKNPERYLAMLDSNE